jgi:dihydrofolate reductase
MGKLIVTEFVSLDGVMEAPGGEPGYPHSGWVFPYHDDGTLDYKLHETLDAEVQLLGRVTYEGFAAAWPQREGEFADKFNEMPKYVVSSTLKDLEWTNSRLLEGGVPDGVERLKDEVDGNILVAGSRTLVHSLIEHDLVDEFHFMVFPLILGSGRRAYPETPDKKPLKLVGSQAFEKGVVVMTYEPVRE